MKIQQIPKFENMNNLTINVYTTNKTGSNIWPIYISKRRGNDPINLLLLCDDEKSHYTLIKNFNGLLRKPKDHPKVFCPYCMHGFDKRYTDDEKMKEHMQDCFTYGAMKIKLPEEGKNIIQHNNISKQLKLPFCIMQIQNVYLQR